MLQENLDVAGLARLPLLRRLMSETCLGNVNMNSFPVIGQHEEREQTNAALCAPPGLESFDNVRANMTLPSAERDHISGDPRILGQLADILRGDVAFYERWAKP